MYVFMYIYTQTHIVLRLEVYVYLCIYTCMYIHTPEVALNRYFPSLTGYFGSERKL